MRRQGLVLALLLSVVATVAFAEVNSMYFMKYLPYKMYMNPAFQNQCETYVELPGISTISTEVNAGVLNVNDIIKFKDGVGMVTFLHPSFNNTEKDALYKKLRNVNTIHEETNVSIFGFGFRIKKKGYLTVNMSVRQDATGYIPKDLFSLALYGTPDSIKVNNYNLTNTKATANAYIDLNGGYSHRINDKWSVGGRLHLLFGLANANASFSDLQINAESKQWHATGTGVINTSVPGMEVTVDEKGQISGFKFPSQFQDYLKSYKLSMGAAIDLGGVYKPIKDLSISLSIKDAGFMVWNNVNKANGNIDYTFKGIEYHYGEKNVNYGDSILKVLQESYRLDRSTNTYVTAMNAKMYFGVEYSFLKDMMSVGLLSRTDLNAGRLQEELTLAYNIHPCYWFSMSASYSFISGGFSTLGLGLNLRLPPFNFYVVTDYMPLYYSAEGIPYRSQRVNVQAGILLTFGCDNQKTKPLFEPTF